MSDNILLLFFLALQKKFVELSEIKQVADDIIMKNNPSDCGYYLFEISLSHDANEILQVLQLEI